ncbi:hypothetical protein LOCC1_G000505 [Lachnellula occidentalis]|uniref:Uncharacterized protein n=1 Tax=Lachnellula occidentalis TaxID=215460 RepID=A0A8H8S9S5_9HELO|nr:hypothetical protein LOCC1_G000505 [Lachnellula occidentalis]
MPSFSFLKNPKRESQPIARDGSGSLDHDSTEKARGKQSKRRYFRSLIKKASVATESKSHRSRGSQHLLKKANPNRSELLASPEASPILMSTNKPLPRRPAASTSQPDSPSNRTKNLERIISPIALNDLHKLFSGAPQFFVRSEGHHTGAPHPSVSFPWDVNLQIRDLCDHGQIRDEAWGCVTAWRHITLQVSQHPNATKEHHIKQRACFVPRCRERPNMLSMQGIERGTIGYEAALELGVADALQEEVADETPQSISERRRKLLIEKDGLRPLTDSTLTDRLMSVSDTYYEDSNKHRLTVELYSELFTQFLYPPTRVTDSQDPYSLQVQIEALIHVLNVPHVWVNFGLVEWRIRLGQILWGFTPGSDVSDEVTVNSELTYEPDTQKYWLLLQILLSCELLLRLDAISKNIDDGLEELQPPELLRFEKEAKTSVKWSLILARQWLENIKIVKVDQEIAISTKAAPGWLATLTRTSENDPTPTEHIDIIKFHGRNQTRQLYGLLHFARILKWPNLAALTAKVSSNGITISESPQITPAAGTPLSMSTQRSSSYFSSQRPGAQRGLSTQKIRSAIIHPAGWLSNSYISGLVLPGEGLSHFLISTLLEHDEAAVEKLGDEANLYGGFVYAGRSFWSTACIIGRVLAAGKGASECMGWVSSDVVPQGNDGDRWVDIEADSSLHDDADKQTAKARIWHKKEIETHGNLIGGTDASSILPGDFVFPSDESLQPPLAVNLECLQLIPVADSVQTSTDETPTPLTGNTDSPGIQTYSAMINFIIHGGKEAKKDVNLTLIYDARFVTAHPCIPSTEKDLLKSATTTSRNSSYESSVGSPGSPSLNGGHPLHKAFTYTRIPILDVLNRSSSLPFSSLLSPPQSPDPGYSSAHTTSSTIPKVLVIDCTHSTTVDFLTRPKPSPSVDHKHNYGSDLEILARALCAERGWNALISRRGRGCVACAVREAGALGFRVVLRLA